MANRGARIWARVSVMAGIVVLVVGTALSVLVPLAVPIAGYTGSVDRPFELVARLAVAAGLFMITILVATPLIVSGQILMALVDIRRASVRIQRRLRRRRPRDDRGFINRLRPR